MRFGWVIVIGLLCGCASEQLRLAPPGGVNFSGHWVLNEADSDDPVRVAQSQATANAAAAAAGGQSGQGGQGGRGGGRGGRPGTGLGGAAAPLGPAAPGISVMSDGLRWPGREIEIKQVSGVVSLTSAGATQIYQPSTAVNARPKLPPEGVGRGLPPRDRGDGPPPVCGWDERTLVVKSDNPDDEHPPFEERYSLSADGQRLIEVVAFNGGRSGGFTVSRVWDKVP